MTWKISFKLVFLSTIIIFFFFFNILLTGIISSSAQRTGKVNCAGAVQLVFVTQISGVMHTIRHKKRRMNWSLTSTLHIRGCVSMKELISWHSGRHLDVTGCGSDLYWWLSERIYVLFLLMVTSRWLSPQSASLPDSVRTSVNSQALPGKMYPRDNFFSIIAFKASIAKEHTFHHGIFSFVYLYVRVFA